MGHACSLNSLRWQDDRESNAADRCWNPIYSQSPSQDTPLSLVPFGHHDTFDGTGSHLVNYTVRTPEWNRTTSPTFVASGRVLARGHVVVCMGFEPIFSA